jgi:hypothetical protein
MKKIIIIRAMISPVENNHPESRKTNTQSQTDFGNFLSMNIFYPKKTTQNAVPFVGQLRSHEWAVRKKYLCERTLNYPRKKWLRLPSIH